MMEQTPEEMGAGRRAGSRKEKPSLLARAVSYLSRREYSRRELGEKLRRLGSEDDAKVDEVLDYLEEKGYLSNERFAEQFLRRTIAVSWRIRFVRTGHYMVVLSTSSFVRSK